MYKVGQYIVLFVSLVLLQVLLFNNLMLCSLLVPMVYIAFVALLPTQLNKAVVIVAGFATGVLVDLMSGTAGLNTIALTATAFLRPLLINLTMPKQILRDNITPDRAKLGFKEYFGYTSLFVVTYNLLFFFFEALTFKHVLTTLLKVTAGSLLSIVLIWLLTELFSKLFNDFSGE